MNKALTTHSNKMPAPMTRDLSTTVAKFRNRLEEHPGPYRHFSICGSQAPAGSERQALEDRRHELQIALTAGRQNVILQEILDLKGAFSTGNVDEATAVLNVQAYVLALKDYPEWAVKEACLRFKTGKVQTPWRPSFCPTSAEVAAECRAIISPVQEELIPLNDILDAQTYPPPDPDYEKRLAAVMKWEKDIRPGMASKEQTKPQAGPQVALNRIKSEGWGELQVSDAIKATLPNMKRGDAA